MTAVPPARPPSWQEQAFVHPRTPVYYWRSADGATGQLTGRAAEIVAVLAATAEEWEARQADGALQTIIHGASIGTEDHASKVELRALRDAMTHPVAMRREG